MKAFLEVTEQRTKPLDQLYLSILEAYKKRLDGDDNITVNLKPHFLSAKFSDDRALGKSLWDRAKVYKGNFLNIYLPNLPQKCPSGHNMDDLMEICRKRSWLQIKRQKKEGPLDNITEDDCPPAWMPVDFYAFEILHTHPKFLCSSLKGKEESSSDDSDMRVTVVSRRQQRMAERAAKRQKHSAKAEQDKSDWNAVRGMLAKQKMKVELVKLAIQLGDNDVAKKLFREAVELEQPSETTSAGDSPPATVAHDGNDYCVTQTASQEADLEETINV